MRRIKFFSATDIMTTNQCQKIEAFVLSKPDLNKELFEINEIIEFYNISLYITNCIYLKTWDKEFIKKLKELIVKFNKIIALYFKKIDADNFERIASEVDIYYKEDFIGLLCKYKVYEIIPDIIIQKVINTKILPMGLLLQEKFLVSNYEELIKNEFVRNPLHVEFMLTKFLTKSETSFRKKEIYLPKTFSSGDISGILEGYINSPDVNINYLRLIRNAQSTKEFVVSDEIRLKAKKRIEKIEEDLLPSSGGGVKLEFYVVLDPNQKEPIIESNTSKKYSKTYSLDWFEQNLDNATILQNFIYLFEYVDSNMRISLVSYLSQMGILENLMGIKGKNDYLTSISYETKNTFSNMEISMYYDYLSKKNIRLEEVLEWFFSNYLKDEFQIDNYIVKLPSPTSSYREKCRDLLPEMESIFKQFYHLVKFGEINHELIQISSSSMKLKDLPSKIDRKYVYANEEKLKSVFYWFFSDQSGLSYLDDHEVIENSFFDLLRNRQVNYRDIPDYNKSTIDFLIDTKYLKINEENCIEINNILRMGILYQLYNFETINFHRFPNVYNDELSKMISEGLIFARSTFFSVPEQMYFNFHLNKSEFSNGLDLRNRYSHGSQPNAPNEEFQHKINYMILLKLLVLIVIKINDEFCIKMDLLKD